ncbi:MAG: hypothetical protein IJV35_07185 [Neisseriaceae bacterium]|nr:hypothetical protein [Neisseriaceae bacterium]
MWWVGNPPYGRLKYLFQAAHFVIASRAVSTVWQFQKLFLNERKRS